MRRIEKRLRRAELICVSRAHELRMNALFARPGPARRQARTSIAIGWCAALCLASFVLGLAVPLRPYLEEKPGPLPPVRVYIVGQEAVVQPKIHPVRLEIPGYSPTPPVVRARVLPMAIEHPSSPARSNT